MERTLSYFASDVHLGLDVNDPAAREERFIKFLREIPSDRTENLFLLGDIWDFWYEYRDVVPKGYARVFSAIQDLIATGVNVYFCPGNHDVWAYSYFEQLGMKKIGQPHLMEIGGKKFCVGHGHGLGPVGAGAGFLNGLFHNRVAQCLFSALHPWFAFRFGNSWSRHNRLSRKEPYIFETDKCPLVAFVRGFAASHEVDFFVFGHYHVKIDEALPSGARLLMLGDWVRPDSYFFLVFDAATSRFSTTFSGYSQNIE